MSDYQIVVIKDNKKYNCKKPIIVPKEYITTNNQMQSFVRYLALPHSNDDKLLIESFVKSRANPPESWSSYRCEIKYVTDSYEKARTILESFQLPAVKEGTRKPNKKTQFATLLKASSTSSQQISFDTVVASVTQSISPSSFQITTTEAPSTCLPPPLNLSMPINPAPTLQVSFFEDNTKIEQELLSVPSLDQIQQNDVSNEIHEYVLSTDFDEASLKQDISNTIDESKSTDKGNSDLDEKYVQVTSDMATKADLKALKEEILKAIAEQHTQAPSESHSHQFLDVTCEMVSKADFEEFKQEILGIVSQQSQQVTNEVRDVKTSILKDLTSFKKKNSEVLKSLENFYSFDNFKDDYNYDFPLQSEEMFDNFNTDISKNVRNIKDNLKRFLTSVINPAADFLDTTRDILKRFLKKDVLSFYVAQRASQSKKKVFKDTSFYVCFKDSVCCSYQQVNKKMDEIEILRILGVAFSNVKDWEGGRIKRLKKADEN